MNIAITHFARNMQTKLDRNKNKPCPEMNPDGKGRTWKHCKLQWLLQRLREETTELEETLKKLEEAKRLGCSERVLTNVASDVMFEAADVGNFAMMIHDIAMMVHYIAG